MGFLLSDINKFLLQYGLHLESTGFQVIAGLLLFFILITIILLFKNRSKKKKISLLEKTLSNELDEKTFLLNDKNEKNKRYEILSHENETLYTESESNKQTIEYLNKKKSEAESLNENLKQELQTSKENSESTLNASKAIIKTREEEYAKLNQTFLTLQEQLRRETHENIAFGDEIKKQKETINNLQHNLTQTLETNQNHLTKITVLEDELKQYQKKKSEEEKRRQFHSNMEGMKNHVYQCFQSIDHPIFACYRSDETRGTYLHVNQVAQLSYYAAIAIGANAEYARASALFHDLGKTSIFKYFKENWPHNKSQKLEAENFSFTFTHRGQMICSHVERGVQIFQKLANQASPDVDKKLSQYNLSDAERSFIFEEAKEELLKSILEHQAKSQVRMLYDEARKNGEICQQKDFEYEVGQIPSNREQGIICLADSCEAAFSSHIHESEEAVANLITQVITGRLNAGHMNNSGLSTRDIQMIKKTFIEYLTEFWKAKRPDRLEEKVEIDPEGYSNHDTGNELIRQMTIKFTQGDAKQKRKVLSSFIDLKQKTLNAINIEDLMQPVEELINTESGDTILSINCLVALTAYYRSMATQIIDDIQRHHPIHFKLRKETGDLELVQNSDLLAYIDAKPVLKQYLNRMQVIRENVTSAMRNLRVYESPDIYVIKWATQIDNYLNNQSNIPEPMDKSEKIEVFSQLQNVVTTPEDFSHFISVKQEIIYVNINLDIFRCDCKFVHIIVYFYNHKMVPLVDNGGMFCTKTNSQVAILQSFLIKNSKFFSIKESAVVLPQSELHLPNNYDKPVIARIQIHGIRTDDKPILLFDRSEEFHTDLGSRLE